MDYIIRRYYIKSSRMTDKIEYKAFKNDLAKIFAKNMLNDVISLNCICTIQIGKLGIT